MTTLPHRWRYAALPLLLALTTAAGCASSPAAGPAAAPPASTAPPTGAAPSAGASGSDGGPSAASRMVCAGYVLQQLAGALGTEPLTPPSATWAQHLYSCAYAYTDASMVVSVKELADPATAVAHFDGLRGSAGAVTTVNGLGEAAFTQADGSTVVKKDNTVLVVDVSRLPERFGTPPRTRPGVSVMVATTIMTCWKEHA